MEIGQQLFSPAADAAGEGVEGGKAGAVSGGEERVEALLSVSAIFGAVYVTEALLQAPGLGEDWLAFEEFAQPSALALSRPVENAPSCAG